MVSDVPDRHEAAGKIMGMPQVMPQVEGLEYPGIEHRAANRDRGAGRARRRVREHLAMLARHGGACELAARLLQLLASKRGQPLPVSERERRRCSQAGSLNPRTIERDAAVRVRDQPAEQLQLVLEKPLGRPPLAVLQLLLERKVAGAGWREIGSTGQNWPELHGNAA